MMRFSTKCRSSIYLKPNITLLLDLSSIATGSVVAMDDRTHLLAQEFSQSFSKSCSQQLYEKLLWGNPLAGTFDGVAVPVPVTSICFCWYSIFENIKRMVNLPPSFCLLMKWNRDPLHINRKLILHHQLCNKVGLLIPTQNTGICSRWVLVGVWKCSRKSLWYYYSDHLFQHAAIQY